jgi:hypothetical protein
MAINKVGYHNQNEIIAKIQTALTTMLTDLNIDWQVLRSNQPTVQELQNNSIYHDIISKRRIGTQGVKSILIDNNWQDVSIWYEEYLVQISGFKQRDVDTDTELTLTSSDVIALLQGCINSNGAIDGKKYFNADWLQVIKSTDIRELDFETDSGLKEKMPQFDFILVVEQALTKEINKVDDIEMDIHRV